MNSFLNIYKEVDSAQASVSKDLGHLSKYFSKELTKLKEEQLKSMV
jgi:hypothetical protein